MDKPIIDPSDSEEFTEWMFPLIDIVEESNEDEKIVDVMGNETTSTEKLLEEKRIENDIEIQKLKKELNDKSELLNKIIKKLEGNLDFVDKDFIDLIHNIIKKMVKNIINKEIKSDSKIVNKIILDLKELIHEKNGMVSVFLSEIDFKRFNKNETKDLLSVKVDPSLNEGDVILKSNHTEIHAMLNERLEKMLGNKK